jgi:hypothetical protein
MLRAIAKGLEHPPTIGVVKDVRPLNVPRLFEPVPHSSGCTSPALECAELMAPTDCLAPEPESPIKVKTDDNTEASELCGTDAVTATDEQGRWWLLAILALRARDRPR